MTIYFMNAANFCKEFTNQRDMQVWYDNLKQMQPGIVGSKVVVWKGEGSLECYSLNGKPVLQGIIQA